MTKHISLSKMYLMSPQHFESGKIKSKDKEEIKKKIIKKAFPMKKKDNILKWNEQSRDLQMRLIKKLQNHRTIQPYATEKQHDQETLTIPQTTSESTPEAKIKTRHVKAEAAISTPITHIKLQAAKQNAINNRTPKITKSESPVNLSPQMQLRSQKPGLNKQQLFIPFNDNKSRVTHTPLQTRKQKGKGYISWISID